MTRIRGIRHTRAIFYNGILYAQLPPMLGQQLPLKKHCRQVENFEVKITVLKWLYDGIRAKGALFEVDPNYFDLVSDLKLFLYQSALMHIGQDQDSREVSIEELYDKSGSEGGFSLFRKKMIDAVVENDIPCYSIK